MVERDLSEPAVQDTASRGREIASLLRRFCALLADWLACVLISSTFAHPTTEGWAPVLVLIFEYGFFVGFFGQTPGMFITGLRCVDVATDRPIGVPRALLRAVLLCMVVPAVIMDSDRRGVHDRLASSIVVTR